MLKNASVVVEKEAHWRALVMCVHAWTPNAPARYAMLAPLWQ